MVVLDEEGRGAADLNLERRQSTVFYKFDL
jgi:hypothetical protein